MLINIMSAKCIGIEAVPVTVEVDITSGIGVHLVGMADVAVKESLLRTITALQSLGFHIPGKKIVINLAPADLRKSGGGYDLPIALGIIAASGQRELPGLGKYIIMGELGLDGALRPIQGSLPIADLASSLGKVGCVFPLESAMEAVECEGISIFGPRDLMDVLRILEERDDTSDLLVWNTGLYRSFMEAGSRWRVQSFQDVMDFSDIIGQESAKRGAEIAAAGGHNIIMIGPPGSGKSSLAKALGGILPPMTKEESIVTSKIYSVYGMKAPMIGLIKERPFRSPHYSASLPAIIGGGAGQDIRPGEVTLAHNGILFLDEYGQMPKSVLEALRGPMEDRKVTISRLRSKLEYPSSFMLVAASNPCPCGYYGEGDRCRCTPGQRAAYLSRLSGPIMDRIDIQLWLRPVETRKLVGREKGEPGSAVAARVMRARAVQRERLAGEGIFTNAEMSGRMIEKYCPLDSSCERLMEKMMDKLGLSARAYSRILKVARTIADLEGSPSITTAHLAEAVGYRFLDKRDAL
ncbi:MAG: YifB family Mg chelatase-like AAA ATPase [Bacteroidales bacterium]|nr:YifB family Mg chelatase-like AAA ATPase [Bacteroidales bacterium]